MPQLCVAWVLAQGKDVVPVIGTKHREKLDENLEALHIKLSAGRMLPTPRRTDI